MVKYLGRGAARSDMLSSSCLPDLDDGAGLDIVLFLCKSSFSRVGIGKVHITKHVLRLLQKIIIVFHLISIAYYMYDITFSQRLIQ